MCKNQLKTKQSLQTEQTLLSFGLHEEVSHGFRSRAFWLSRSAWKALMWWVMKGCRPSLNKIRHRPAFSQFLYPLSLRRAASSSRTMAALFPDRKHNKGAEQVQTKSSCLAPPFLCWQQTSQKMAPSALETLGCGWLLTVAAGLRTKKA